jgi:actin-related protein
MGKSSRLAPTTPACPAASPSYAMFSGDEVGALVGDIGSHTVKIGFGGEDTPRFVDRAPALPSLRQHDVDAQFVAAWNRGLSALRVDASEHPILASCPTLATDKERARLTELLVEKLHAPLVFVMRSAVLSAFASGRSTALVVDVGASATVVAPVFEGHALLRATRRSSPALAGNGVTARLAEAIKVKDLRWAEDCKHAMAKVWRDEFLRGFQESMASQGPVSYELPDRTKVMLGAERYQVCEPLFDEHDGLGPIIHQAVAACDASLRKAFLQEMLVVGGSSLLDGLAERMGGDMDWRMNRSFKPRVSAPGTAAERRFSSFVGGSVLAALGSFQQLWLSKQEYDEFGAARAVAERFVQ